MGYFHEKRTLEMTVVECWILDNLTPPKFEVHAVGSRARLRFKTDVQIPVNTDVTVTVEWTYKA